MKKILTLIVTAIVCLTAFAQQEVALSPKAMVEEATIVRGLPMRTAKKHFAKPGQTTNFRAAKKAKTAADIVGTYVSYNDIDSPVSGYEYDYSTLVTIVAGEEENTVLITGLFGQNDEYPLKGTVQDGQLIIPSNQQINEDETYGKVTLGVITDKDDDETGLLSDAYNDETHPIIFDIYNDGLMLIDTQYGVARFVPEYKEGVLVSPFCYSLTLFEPNGTMTSEIAVSASDPSVGETRTDPVRYVMNNGEALVMGFDKNYVGLIQFKTDGTCSVSSSKPLYFDVSKMTYAYAFKADKNSTTGNWEYCNNTDPEGIYTDNTIELGMWGLCMETAADGIDVLNGHVLNSKIVFNEGVLKIPDYSALEGTYRVDAKVEVHGACQGEDLLEALEIQVKQNIKAGYIDVTLPACTLHVFSMDETVISDVEVTPSSVTPGKYLLTPFNGDKFPIVVGGKTINASMLGTLDTNNASLYMLVWATLPDGLGRIEITYSESKPKPQTGILSWEDNLTPANEIILSNDIKLAITGNTGKNCTAGNGSITVDGTTYRTLKNSNGAQNTLTAPAGQLIKAVTFYAVGNYTDKGNPVLSEFEGASTSYEVTSLTDYANPTVIPCTLATPAPSVTFTFSKCQVCYIAVVEYDKGTPTAIYTVEEENTPKERKYIRNGQLIIERNGQKFNAAGMKM